jgi:hypothetical protein
VVATSARQAGRPATLRQSLFDRSDCVVVWKAKRQEIDMSDWDIWATGHMTALFLILVLALDIGGAGTILAAGAAEAHGQHIHILRSP